MAVQKKATETYQQQCEQFNQQLQVLLRKHNRIGWLRLCVSIATLIIAIQAFSAGVLPGVLSIVIGIAGFLFLVSIDVANNHRITHLQQLLHLNTEELRILADDYKHRFDGHHFLPPQHEYAADLDVFGTASLFQYLNRCSSEQGLQLLAQNLLDGLPSHEIQNRQQAVAELTPELEWRQNLQALLLPTPVTKSTERKTIHWLSEKEQHFTHTYWPYVVTGYSVVTLASAALAIAGVIPASSFSGLFVLYLIFAMTLSRKATKAYTQLNGIVNEIAVLQRALQHVEEKSFQAAELNALQQSLRSGSHPAYGEMKKLQALLNRFDMRLNVYVFLFLNSFLLWDVRQMIALNAWRRQNKAQVGKWFAALAQIEVLISLATLRFNQPEWAWPKFSDTYFTLNGTALGHPLIPKEQRVVNDFDLNGIAKVALITGSNMAGKSTFLRSLGVNVVLAQLGAPVCATAMTLSPVRLMSSMRIADNLAENTSTFYAELKKLKRIIEAMQEHRPVFILLDEVLRGTNSLDRHIAPKRSSARSSRKGHCRDSNPRPGNGKPY
jgi:ABC-type multidrug transport system fused ATPase/permease subunit